MSFNPSLPTQPTHAGRAPRAVTASSSLGTIRARIAELRRIVADPERYLPGLDERTRILQVASYGNVILRLEDMERAKASSRMLGDTRAVPNNTVRRALKAPLTTLNALRLHMLTTLDSMRIERRIDVAKGALLETSDAVDRGFAIMRERIDAAQAEVHAQIERNLLMLYGGDSDDEATDSDNSTERAPPEEEEEENTEDKMGADDGIAMGSAMGSADAESPPAD